MSDWVANTGSWIEHHPGAAAWVQAIGATLAVIAAVLVPALQARHTRRQLGADRRLRAKSLAIAIYPELLHIRIAYRHIVGRLQQLIEHARDEGGSGSEVAGSALAGEARHLLIPISDALRAMVPDFYLLGDPIGPEVQKCIGRSMKYNDVLNSLFTSSARIDLAYVLGIIQTGLHQAEACIAQIEQAWNISAEERHGFEEHTTGQAAPAPKPRLETISKETV